jgi:hypothetical protein
MSDAGVAGRLTAGLLARLLARLLAEAEQRYRERFAAGRGPEGTGP